MCQLISIHISAVKIACLSARQTYVTTARPLLAGMKKNTLQQHSVTSSDFTSF